MSEVYDDYTIDMKELESKTDRVNLLVFIGLMIFSVLANTGLMLLLFAVIPGLSISLISIPIALGLGVAILIAGIFGGFAWEFIGVFIARSFYAAYLPELKNNTVSKVYRRFIDEDNQVFIEARSKDQRLKNIVGIAKLLFRISISELSFYLFVTSFVVLPMSGFLATHWSFYAGEFRNIVEPAVALGISVIILALYLPMSFILSDANIRTFDPDERVMDTPGSKIRGIIDGLVGLGAVTSGTAIFEAVRASRNNVFLVGGSAAWQFYLDYTLWLLFIMLITWPLMFPAMLVFILRYQKTVNKFRINALKIGIPLGVARIRPPYEDEKTVIVEYLDGS